jgi:hypothetical protein
MALEDLADVDVELVENKYDTQHVVLDVGCARVFISHTDEYQTSIVVNGSGDREQASIVLDADDEVDGVLHGPSTPARHSEYRLEHPRAGINSI